MTTQREVNILLVDDEPANLTALEAILESLGQNLIKATSGSEALRQVLTQEFAVILLDVQLPDINGIEAAALIRERERSRHIPIIFLTGAVRTAEMMFKGYSTGAVDYLMKPVVPEILRAKVEVFVELAQARQSLHEEINERVRVAAEIATLNVALKQKNDDLLAANADMETFGHSVSHDLRAPLRHIQGYLDMLEESALDKLSEEERRQMERIRKATQRMGFLIDDLLAFSRIGRSHIQKREVKTDALLQDVLQELQPELVERRIVWRIAPLPDLFGDHNLLRQVWVNLLSNAVKYTRPRESAEIAIGSELGADEIVFHVQDNGVGFDMQHADNLFGVFQRLHPESQFEGTGIGLANVRRIVQRHGGRTWAESREGEGATFYFAVPTESSNLDRRRLHPAETEDASRSAIEPGQT